MINDKTAELAIEAALSKGGDFARDILRKYRKKQYFHG